MWYPLVHENDYYHDLNGLITEMVLTYLAIPFFGVFVLFSSFHSFSDALLILC